MTESSRTHLDELIDEPISFTVTKPKRRDVMHFAWIADLEFAEPIGIQVRAICGSMWLDSDSVGEDEVYNPVKTVGGLMPIKKRRDCLRCLRVLEAQLRRDWEAK